MSQELSLEIIGSFSRATSALGGTKQATGRSLSEGKSSKHLL
jgi:hypothetical protein